MEGHIGKIFSKKNKNAKSDEASSFVLQKDKERIAQLTAEEVRTEAEYKEKAKQLDQKISQIQQSTRTSIPYLQHFHEKMRLKYQWYYKWHLWPYSRVAHFLILAVYFISLTIIGSHYFNSPKTIKAGGGGSYSCIFSYAGTDYNWSSVENWGGDCDGTQYPGSDPESEYSVTITAGNNVILDVDGLSLDTGLTSNLQIDNGASLSLGSNTLSTYFVYLNGGLSLNSGTLNIPGGMTVEFGSFSGGDGVLNIGQYGGGSLTLWPDAIFSVDSGDVNFIDAANPPFVYEGGWTFWGDIDATVTFSISGETVVNIPADSYNNVQLQGDALYDFGAGTSIRENFTSSANIKINDSFVVGNNVDLTDGSFDSNGQSVNIGGNFSLSDGTTFTKGSTLTFSGTAASTYSDANTTKQNLGVVQIAKTNGTSANNKVTLATVANNGMLVSTLAIAANNTLDMSANGYTLEIANNGSTDTVFTNSGTFSAGTSTVKYSALNSGGNVKVAAVPYNNLQISGNETYALAGNLTGANTITGNLTINNGTTLNHGSNYSIALVGNWIGGDTSVFTPGTGTVSFTKAADTQTLDAGGDTFYNVTHSGAGTLQVANHALVMAGDLINSAGTMDINGQNLTIGAGKTFTNNATFKLLGSETLTNLASHTDNGTVKFYASAGGPYNLPAWTYNDLEIAGGAGQTFRLSGDTIISGDFTRTSGVFDANSHKTTLSGSAFQQVSNVPSFYDLTVTNATQVSFDSALTVTHIFLNNTPDSTMTFKEGSVNDFNTINWLGGAGGHNLKLESASTPTQWSFTYTTRTNADYLQAIDTNNTGALLVVPHFVNTSNNNGFYYTSNYIVTTTSPTQIAGVGFSEQVTAKDSFGATITAANYQVHLASASATVKFYDDATYTNEVLGSNYTLVNGVATIYVKDNTLAAEDIVLTATDTYSAATGSSDAISIVIPTPASTITSPLDGTTVGVGITQILGTSSDIVGVTVTNVEVRINSGAWQNATDTGVNYSTWSYDANLPSGGDYVIQSRATDNLGFVETPGAGITLHISTGIPTVQITKPTQNQWITSENFDASGVTTNTGTPISKVEVTLDGANWQEAVNTGTNFSSWSYPLTGLSDNRYTLSAKATDTGGNSSALYTVFFGFDRVAPTVSANFSAFNVSNLIADKSQAFFWWEYSTDATSGVKEYQLYKGNEKITSTADNFQVLDNPISGTYKVKAVDNAGNEIFSNVSTLDMSVNASKLNISNIRAVPSKLLDKNGKTSTLISWETSEPSTSLVYFGLGGAKANQAGIDNQLNYSHNIVLSNLEPNTNYHYAVFSRDIYGKEVLSSDQIFISAEDPTSDTLWARVSKTFRSSLEWMRKSFAEKILTRLGLIKSPLQISPQMTVFNVSVPQAQAYQTFISYSDNFGFTLERSNDGQNFVDIATIKDNNYYFDQNLAGNATYYYKASGTDNLVSVSTSGVDTASPIISNLRSKELGSNKKQAEVMISYKTDKLTATEIIINDKIYQNNLFDQSHLAVINNLVPGQTYNYEVRSTDELGNTSTKSGNISIKTNIQKESLWQVTTTVIQNKYNQFADWMRK